MTIHVESLPLADDRPEADVIDQQAPVVDSVDDGGLDPTYLRKPRAWEANEADLIDQAITIALPDDDYEHEAEIDR